MTTKESLGVAVRAIGIWELASGLAIFPTTAWNFYYAEGHASLVSAGRTAVSYSTGQILAGCFLFFGAEWIVRKAYPDPLPSEDEDGSNEISG